MTKEEKQLLTKVLCEGLPYGVKVKYYSMEYPYGSKPVILTPYLLWDRWENINEMRPYLRPMSSMTEEERREYDKLIAKCIYDPEAYFFDNYDRLYDWLLSHYFDYRGLIPMGLALEAPEDMYKTK